MKKKDEYMKIWEKVGNIIKKLIVNLYIINFLKAEKRFKHKRKLAMFLHISNIV